MDPLILLADSSLNVEKLRIQARTSYLPNEILWGHHFENSATVAYDKKVRFRD